MMSRELKLALILGFAAVMVVGVLLSDHMSGARQARIEERTLSTPPLALTTPSGPAYAPLAAPEEREQQLAQTLPETTPPVAADQPAPAQEPPVTIAMGDEPVIADEPAVETLADAGRTSALDDFLAWSEKQGVRFDQIKPSVPLAETDARKPAPPRSTLPSPETLRTPAPSGAETTHTVEEGETLWAIAERYYGDGAQYKRIEEANKGRLGKGDSLYVGAKIVIPGATRAPAANARAAADKPRETPPAAKQPQRQAGERYHVVKKGETLGDIAKEQLGSARRWPEIVKLNKSTIKDPDNVPAGVRLRLPEN